jgi:hypothetical protein
VCVQPLTVCSCFLSFFFVGRLLALCLLWTFFRLCKKRAISLDPAAPLPSHLHSQYHIHYYYFAPRPDPCSTAT